MKNLHLLILALLFISCTESKYTHIGQEIIDGKVSSVEKSHVGRFASYPIIWVQNATETKKVVIPIAYDGKWKVGDSCLLIIEKYKENDTK